MCLSTIINQMEHLHQLHQSLLNHSIEKTAALKKNDITALQSLMAKERKHIQAIDKIEKQRMETVKVFFAEHNINDEEPTVSKMLEVLDDSEEKNQLQFLFEQMIYVLSDLRQQEQLNAELTQQSMQFVQLSMDMLQPQMKNLNYTNTNASTPSAEKRSVFDSKA
ncbi:flagellar protein FlgN [Thalassobacillus hwangdonensis]|uniref:Flagellar protein FlgN n=1 Tax=Thalassobacillus hwangdonensis TaxID=546108 RepID=A0ABW3L2T5_9BACI